MNKILVVNGPNLNILGQREPEIYGDKGLDEIEKFTNDKLKDLGFTNISVDWFQSNAESELIQTVQDSAKKGYEAIIINPAAFTHTSVAILDSLKTLSIPVVEVHLSNTNLREDFRKNKITTLASKHVVEGAGYRVYLLGILSLLIN